MSERFDAVVVGSGPNGLAAAITLARAGLAVVLYESRDEPGGGTRSAELTLPGFLHDVCSAVHPLALASPFFRELGLPPDALEWIQPGAPLAHPLDDGSAALLEVGLEETAGGLGRDGPAWLRMFEESVRRWPELFGELLAPLHLPRHPWLLARFGLAALRSASGLATSSFETAAARALFAGLAAHSTLPLERAGSAAFGLVLGIGAHAVGWPIARGGSRSIAHALVERFTSLGGVLRTESEVRALRELPESELVLLDVSPRALARIADDELPASYRARLGAFRHGPGAFKVDFALESPIPWRARVCARAGTVHLGGTLEEIALSEREASSGIHSERPFVLLVQPSLFDPARAPEGRHIAWAYCHVPNGSRLDMSERIERQIERFAPGFREVVIARHLMSPADFERYDANYVGGDISGGSAELSQLFFRPVARRVPYATPNPRIFLCSASTPPGGGVHGMCGFHAARAALRALAVSRKRV